MALAISASISSVFLRSFCVINCSSTKHLTEQGAECNAGVAAHGYANFVHRGHVWAGIPGYIQCSRGG